MSLKNVSLKQIASELGISINTVSHALRDMNDVSEAVKAKVRKKAIELGYMPNHVVQQMRKDENPVIAIVIDSLSNLYFNTFINELTKIIAKENEYDFLLLYASKLNNDVIKQCILQRADLLITHMELSEEVDQYAKLNNIKIVFVGSNLNAFDLDNVFIDNFTGCVLAARHLHEFKDENKYLYIGLDYFLSKHRYSIFKTEIEALNADAVVGFYNYEKKDISVLKSYIKDGYRKFFFYNDMLAYEVLYKLEKLIPDLYKTYPDIHVIGFDGLSDYVYGLKDIDSIKINFSEFAEATYQVVENRLKNPESKTKKIILPVSVRKE